ncbi:MoeA, N-terminal and linker domain-containing protein [Phialemonium atrogriseum]|uniref:molybdopterin adenylyltransferase n=1 Tax=Phialemonium atrogriseum TaxID=1093897 RepID=A0AAJ0FRD7_9PEZI|nr:MoeA, N-terminal and linker domain-containing protein [Phialemonium atrogriseum]KAK1772198.1 MoeA, N-terminal and linker domain-containing protein [Phialemonium atrogriseum]
MAIRYSCALDIIESVARDMSSKRVECSDLVPLEDGVGRVAGRDHASAEPTPPFDCAAVHGFAVRSCSTINASDANPVVYRVRTGVFAAGDDGAVSVGAAAEDGAEVAVEVAAGTRFPDAPAAGEPRFDACVAAEEVEECKGPSRLAKRLSIGARYIRITKPVEPRSNLRAAGSDLRKGDVIIKAGEEIRSSHVIPLAAAGVSEITVVRRMQVGIWSTGREIVSARGEVRQDRRASCGRDINGPYLMAAVHEAGAEEEFLGVMRDDHPASLEEAIRGELESLHSDVLIITGVVSSGRSCLVRTVLARLGAKIHFHDVAIRPGRPALFATVSGPGGGRAAFFGLPGDPAAAAVGFKFLVTPYLRHVQGQPLDRPIPATLVSRCSTRLDGDGRGCATQATDKSPCPLCMDCFRHGVMRLTEVGKAVALCKDQSPWRVAPYVEANCWVHLNQGQEIVAGAVVPCYPMSASVESMMCNCLR